MRRRSTSYTVCLPLSLAEPPLQDIYAEAKRRLEHAGVAPITFYFNLFTIEYPDESGYF